MKKEVILLNAPKGCGKTTYAKDLEEQGYYRIGFADELKNICYGFSKLIFPYIEYNNFYGTDENKSVIYYNYNPVNALSATKDFISKINVCGYCLDTNQQRNVVNLLVQFLSQEKLSGRRILQFVGTEIIRDIIDEEFHVKIVKNKISSMPHNKFIIDDWRFENELSYLQSDELDIKTYSFKKYVEHNDDHISENVALYADNVIELKPHEFISDKMKG